jgi:hypothetical protein
LASPIALPDGLIMQVFVNAVPALAVVAFTVNVAAFDSLVAIYGFGETLLALERFAFL